MRGPGDLGTFWLMNPDTPLQLAYNRGSERRCASLVTEPNRPTSDSIVANVSLTPPTPDEFCQRLAHAFHPDDHARLPEWSPYYRRLYELACELKPRRICEIGVRASRHWPG